MFTGIVEEIGIVKSVQKTGASMRIHIVAEKVAKNAEIGSSIATNGVCLTVSEFTPDGFIADIMPETFRRSGLRNLNAGSRINLEGALTLSKQLGGHLMQGHVDDIAVIKSISRADNAEIFRFQTKSVHFKYIIPQGSIAIDGASLTVTTVEPPCFEVALIPTTQRDSILAQKKVGDEVNIECDIVGKYMVHIAENYMARKNGQPEETNAEATESYRGSGGITEEYLAINGFLP